MIKENQAGSLLGIAVKAASRAPMEQRQNISVTRESGLVGDYRGGSPRRQVTVLSRESWEAACAGVNAELPWTTRRANLLVDGVALEGTTGRRLRIGDLVLEITGETRPCERMDEALQSLRAALEPDWRGGVTCRVLEGGEIAIGATVSFDE